VIAAALLGGVSGFLVFNFHPAKVFMGDSGSLSMGFLVGCIAVIGMFKTTILAVLVIPFILVAIPKQQRKPRSNYFFTVTLNSYNSSRLKRL